jgi:tetratricopeptide (TPR) repeat protein
VPARHLSLVVFVLAAACVGALALALGLAGPAPASRLAGAFLLGVALTVLLALGRRTLRRRLPRPLARREPAPAAAEMYRRGTLARAAGRAAAAGEWFAAALRAEPGHPGARAALAELALERGDAAGALVHALGALRADDAPELHVLAGRAYAAAARWDEALAAYGEATRRDPEHLPAWRAMREAAVAATRWDQAVAAQERVIALLPAGPARQEAQDGLAAVHYERGRRRLAAGDRDGARLAFEEARRIAPGFLPAVVGLGDALLAAGRPAAALAAWEAGLAAGPALPLLSRIEHLHRSADRPTQMITLYQEAAARWPESLAVAVQLGRVYFELSMLDEAGEQFEKIEVRAPDLPVIHAYLGAIFERRGQVPEAFAEYRELIRLASAFDWPHRCAGCGAAHARWADRCTQCGRWNSLRP